MKKYLLIVVLILSSLNCLLAQQTPTFNQYFKNPFLINPAAAGQEPHTQLMMLYRQQWMDVPGAPSTQALTFTSPLKNLKTGVGLYFYNDVVNIIGRSGGMAAYRYNVQVTRHQQLSFGISAGLASNRIYFDRIKAEDPYETTLLTNMENSSHIDGSFGFLYQFKKLQLGFAALQLFNNSLKYENTMDERYLLYNLIRHYNISATYSFALNENFTLDPFLLVKSAQGLPLHYDVNAILKYKKDSWAGISYKGNSGVAISLGTDFDERFTIGYAFEMPVNALRGISGNTHEVMVGIKIGKGSSGSGLSGTRRKEQDKLQRQVDEQYEMIDELRQGQSLLKNEVQENSQMIASQKDEIEELKKLFREDQEEMKIVIDEVKIDSKPDREKEGDVFYAVVGAFKTVKHAKHYQTILKRELALETLVVQRQADTGNDYYFVFTKSFTQFEEAQEEINRVARSDTKDLINGNPWIYHSTK